MSRRGAGAPAAAAPLLAVALWAIVAAGWPSPALPGPIDVLAAGVDAAVNGPLVADLTASLRRVLRGYLLAVGLAVPLGAVAALGGPWGLGLRWLVAALRPIPPLAWVPLAILWFGLGDQSAVFIVGIGAFLPVFLETGWWLSRPPPQLMELAASLGAGPWLTLRAVRLPAAAPGLLGGLRTGLGLAWTSVIAAELVGAQSGLGYRIQALRLGLDTAGVMATMLVIGALGAAMDAALGALSRRALRWPVGVA